MRFVFSFSAVLLFLLPSVAFADMEESPDPDSPGLVGSVLEATSDYLGRMEVPRLDETSSASRPPIMERIHESYEEKSEEAKIFFFGFHLRMVADVPYEYGVYTYRAARRVDIDPYDLAAFLISEHSGGDRDFSFQSSRGYDLDFKYSPTSEGRGGERGLFQIKPSWMGEIREYYGTEWTKDDLYDPEINAFGAAYIVLQAIISHGKDCGKDSWHDMSAHYKCSSGSRDDLVGGCRGAQMKFEQLRKSLTSLFSVDLKGIRREHKKRLRDKVDREQSGARSSLRGKIRKLCKENGKVIPEGLKKMSLIELQNELMWIEQSLE